MSTPILVTGITGNQGGAVARSLIAADIPVRGLVRDPSSPRAKELAGLDVELVVGHMTDRAALRAAMEGVASVFAVTTPYEAGPPAEIEQGRAMVNAAVDAGVGHFVYNSVASADRNTGIPHFDSKREVEKMLQATELRWTIVAPVYFMENLFLPDTLDGLRGGVYAVPMPPSLKLQQISVADIGAFTAMALRNPSRFAHQRIDIAGDELSSVDAAAALSTALGRPIQNVQVPLEQIREFSEDLAIMFEWFESTGYSADVEGLRTAYPEIDWTRLRDWAPGVVPSLLAA